MDAEQLKDDVRSGRIDAERLVDLVVMLQKQLQDALRRIEELEKELGRRTPPKPDEPFSMRAEEQRQEARGKKKPPKRRAKRRGRNRTAEKVAQAERTEQVFPEGVAENDCKFSHTRPVWRLENGRAVLVAYEIYRAGNRFGKIPGVPDKGAPV